MKFRDYDLRLKHGQSERSMGIMNGLRKRFQDTPWNSTELRTLALASVWIWGTQVIWCIKITWPLKWLVFMTAKFWKWFFLMPSNCSLLWETVSFANDRQNILWANIKMTWINIGKILLPYQWHFLSLFDKLLKYVVY